MIDTKHPSFINPLGFDEDSKEYKELISWVIKYKEVPIKLSIPNFYRNTSVND